jgi:hypothetical protein
MTNDRFLKKLGVVVPALFDLRCTTGGVSWFVMTHCRLFRAFLSAKNWQFQNVVKRLEFETKIQTLFTRNRCIF